MLFIILFAPTKVIAEPSLVVIEVESVEPLIIAPKGYAIIRVTNKWGVEEWKSFETLVQRESQWDSENQNPTSSAYGLGQFLNSTWKTVGCIKTSEPTKQIDCTITYVENVYKTPTNALKHQITFNWY